MARQKDSDFDFAVPGMDDEELGSLDQSEQEREESNQDIKKDISLFWLLQHYNKENAAAYKLQQSRKKEGKQGRKTVRTGKKDKKQNRAEVPAAPVPPSAAKEPPRSEEKRRVVEEDEFGVTVYVNRDSGLKMPDQAVYAKAALECPGYGQTVPVDKLPFTIGRSSKGVDLCIADNRTVGRVHAVISYQSGIFYIRDLNSLNHVFLNGRQIPPERNVELKNNMKITLGDEELIFHYSKM